MPFPFSLTSSVHLIGLLALIASTVHSQDTSQDYVDAHNKARAAVGVGPITWNETLATYAQGYAYTRIQDCTVELSGGPYGENLANGSSDSITGTGIINIWVAEKANYDWSSNSCAGSRRCRNYTQVVWQNSHRLGCARVSCSTGGYFFSCNYDPPGNVVGQRPFEINKLATTPALVVNKLATTPALAVTPNSDPSPAPTPEPAVTPNSDPSPAPTPEPAVTPNSDPSPAPTPEPAVTPNSHPYPAPTPEPAVTPNSHPSQPFISPRQPPNHANFFSTPIGIVAGLISGAIAIILGLLFVWFFLRWKRKRNETHPKFDVSFDDDFENGAGPRKFSYRELASATNNFGEEAKLGEGGFGAVYKGFLKDLNTFAAVKKVSKRSKQGSKEYKTEVKIISQLRHKNTVKLIGWCHENDLILVYEFMPNGSLDSHLFKGKSLLTWTVRYKIVQGLASALLYLHEEGDHCVLHRDIKSSNIMLDSEFNAKLGDFGLARLVDHAKGSETTALAGTIGYMAPECLTERKASKESDVFSFGIVVLEIACGRRSIEHRYDEAQASLVPWVWESYGNKRLLDVVDKKLEMNFDVKQMECLMIVGLWCSHPARNLRPSIRQAIQVLNFELPLPNLPSKMPIPNYDASTSSAPAPNTFSGESRLSLTVPR